MRFRDFARSYVCRVPVPAELLRCLLALPAEVGCEVMAGVGWIEDGLEVDVSGDDFAVMQTAFFLAGHRECLEHVPPSVAEHIWWW